VVPLPRPSATLSRPGLIAGLKNRNTIESDHDVLRDEILAILEVLVKDAEAYWVSDATPPPTIAEDGHRRVRMVTSIHYINYLCGDLFSGSSEKETFGEVVKCLADVGDAMTGGNFGDPTRPTSDMNRLSDIYLAANRFKRQVRISRKRQAGTLSR